MTQNNNSAKLNMYMYVPSSVVQTGVKSAGWLQKQTHESPAHSLKVIEPTVDSFVKFGNVSVLSHRVSKEKDYTGISTKCESCNRHRLTCTCWSMQNEKSTPAPCRSRFTANNTCSSNRLY